MQERKPLHGVTASTQGT